MVWDCVVNSLSTSIVWLSNEPGPTKLRRHGLLYRYRFRASGIDGGSDEFAGFLGGANRLSDRARAAGFGARHGSGAVLRTGPCAGGADPIREERRTGARRGRE